MSTLGLKTKLCTIAIISVLLLVAMLGGVATYIGEANAARVQGSGQPVSADGLAGYGPPEDSWSIPDPFYARE